jgi:D-beta-D-heptose 7-phosphate kinase/D-beta-D-heptose 1-phosphate adenosyltransferase
MINRVVLCTGGFDPIHSGHIEYLKAAKALGNILVVGVNSDAWLTRKKGRAFMPGPERVAIIENLRFVYSGDASTLNIKGDPLKEKLFGFDYLRK